MTHEELLAKIDNGYLSVTDENSYYKSALRAVVELHQPIWTFLAGSNKSIPLCIQCRDEDFIADYPCLTIQEINKNLSL